MTTKKKMRLKSNSSKMWLIHIEGLEFDDGSGRRKKSIPIKVFRVVIASSLKEAIEKATPEIEKVRKRSYKSIPLKVTAEMLPEDELEVRLMPNGSKRTEPVTLVLSETDISSGYELSVCFKNKKSSNNE